MYNFFIKVTSKYPLCFAFTTVMFVLVGFASAFIYNDLDRYLREYSSEFKGILFLSLIGSLIMFLMNKVLTRVLKDD